MASTQKSAPIIRLEQHPPSYAAYSPGQEIQSPPINMQQQYNPAVSPPQQYNPAAGLQQPWNPSPQNASSVGQQYQQQLYAMCAAGKHDATRRFGLCGILTAIFCFPCGLICLFSDSERRCTRCGELVQAPR